MSKLSDLIPQYVGSEHFFLLDAVLKENAESSLSLWCETAGDNSSLASVEGALKRVAQLEAPVEQRRAFPGLLKAYLGYLDDSGHFAEAPQWLRAVEHAEGRYVDGFRADGTFRGGKRYENRLPQSAATNRVRAAVAENSRNAA